MGWGRGAGAPQGVDEGGDALVLCHGERQRAAELCRTEICSSLRGEDVPAGS